MSTKMVMGIEINTCEEQFCFGLFCLIKRTSKRDLMFFFKNLKDCHAKEEGDLLTRASVWRTRNKSWKLSVRNFGLAEGFPNCKSFQDWSFYSAWLCWVVLSWLFLVWGFQSEPRWSPVLVCRNEQYLQHYFGTTNINVMLGPVPYSLW